MSDDEYFVKLKYGNVYINILPKILPLLLWLFFIYKYYFKFYVKETNYSYIFLFLMCLPFLIIILEILVNYNILMNNDSLVSPVTWKSCFSLFETKDRRDGKSNNQILGKYSYKCGSNLIDYLQNMMKQFQYRFYYLNFTLFLLLLISQNFSGLIKIGYKHGNYHIIFIAITLFFGALGVLPSSFAYSYTLSLIMGMIFSTILNMNISAFLITLYSISIKLR